MLTIPNAVEEVIKKKPFLEGALVEGLINLSALARQLKPEIEKKVGKEVNDSAVIMALNRLVPRLELMSAMKFKKVVENIGDIIVRSNLADYAFVNSPTLYEKQAQLLGRVRSMKDVFCTFSQGIYETTLVVSSSMTGMVDEIFAEETNIAKTVDLSSITVKLPVENTICPGVYYYIFKELAWDNINITEVISTTNEFTVVISDNDIHRAFTILMEAQRMAGACAAENGEREKAGGRRDFGRPLDVRCGMFREGDGERRKRRRPAPESAKGRRSCRRWRMSRSRRSPDRSAGRTSGPVGRCARA